MKEIRAFTISELRVANDGSDNPTIEGYAAIFNSLSDDLGGFREIIKPGAFAETITTADVRALWNHNPDYVLGRTKSGTLTLSEDSRGLKIICKPPTAQWAQDLMESMKRGDVDQMSFGFRTISDSWGTQEGTTIRELQKVELFDVSPVTYPAYPATEVGVRSAKQVYQSYKDSLGSDSNKPPNLGKLDTYQKTLDLVGKE